MSTRDDSNMSLFGDELPPVPSAPEPEPKKPRAKRAAREPVPPAPEAPTAQDTPHTSVEAPALASNPDPAPQPNTPSEPLAPRRSPWAKALSSGRAVAPNILPAPPAEPHVKPHVFLVVTDGDDKDPHHHVLNLCDTLHAEVNFTVVMGPTSAESALGHQLEQLGVRVCILSALVDSRWPWHVWKATQALIALIEATPPDVIHAHSTVAGLVVRLACQRSARPVVYTVHGFGLKADMPPWRRVLALWAERVLSGWTSHMICVSAYDRLFARRLRIDPNRVHVIQNGLALSPALPLDPTPAHPTAQDNATPTPPRLIMAAPMTAHKRQDLLLHVLAKVRDWLGHELPTTLAGSGPLLAQHQALAKQLGLQHIAWVSDARVSPEMWSQHDVFVLLSDQEDMPIAVLEAMRAGLPVLASDLPGLREQVMHGHEGLLASNKKQLVAHHLLRLAQDPSLRQRLGRAGQERFQIHFNRDDTARRVLAIYRQCLSEDFATSRPNTTLGSALVSASVRQRDALQSWTLWGVWLLLPSLLLANSLESLDWVTPQFAKTLWWCIVPYAVASQLLMRTSNLPLAERSGVLWVSTAAPFLFTPLGFALLQQPYSRAAVVWAYWVTTVWLWWGYRRRIGQRALHLVHVDAEVPAQLAGYLAPQTLDPHAITLQAWHLGAKVALPACDGVVLDRHVPPGPERTRLLSQLKMQHLRLYSVESVAELLSGRKMLPHAADSLWEIDNDPGYDRLKRLIDVCLVLLLSPLWVPLALAVGLAVRLDSPGPALYSQIRVGRYGQGFRLWKFRSMTHTPAPSSARFAQADDPRITRLGHLIRRTRLDELPQLWNVLWGQMSLIGPRPEQAPFVREFATNIPSYPYRHLVRPGLTGWAQVQQGYADSQDSTRIKLSYDLYYVAHYSLALDLLIAVKTVRTVLTGFGSR